MGNFSGQLADRSAIDVLRELGSDRRTGVLDLTDGETARSERYFLVGGELYLAPDDPIVAGPDPAVLKSPDAGAVSERPDGRHGVGKGWLANCADRLQSWRTGTFRFSEDLAAIPSDLVGPMPTFSIVMAGAVAGSSEFDLLRRLGGEEARFLAMPPSRAPAPDLLQLDTHEAFFLSRLEQMSSVKELLAQSELDQVSGLRKLCRLLAVGLICREEERPESDATLLLTSEILEKFSDRIERSLQRKPLDLSVEEHRQLIADMLARVGGVTYYQLLDLTPVASSEEVHDAYSRVARIVHPSNAPGLGLAGREAGMRLLFETATEAYLTLIDGEKSRRYLQRVGSVGGDVEPLTGDSRRGEMVRVAEETFRRAKSLFAREEYHFAVELLQQAVRIDARPEYFVLLGRCQAQNPKWLGRSIASFERALELDATDDDVRLELAGMLEAAGEDARAEQEYGRVLQKDPERLEASAALARLSATKRGGRASRKVGWIQRVLLRLRPHRKE